MKRLVFVILSLVYLIGCRTPLYMNLDSRQKTYIKDPIIRQDVCLSPDDKNMFFILNDYQTIKKDSTVIKSQLCSYNLVTDSTTVLLISDSVNYRTVFCSNDGTKILYVSLNKRKGYCINIYDLTTKENTLVFHHPYATIFDAVLSADNKYIYFTSILTIKNNTTSTPHCTGTSIFSMNINGPEITRISTFYNLLIPIIHIDKTGENLYFSIYSDSIKGPYRLNLSSNTLTYENPDFNKIHPNLNNNQKFYTYLAVPIPSDSDSFIFLYTGAGIVRYYEKNGTMTRLYALSSNQLGVLREQLWCPTVFHKSEKLLMLKDTTNSEQNFIILNEKGQIEKTFRPSIAKYPIKEKRSDK